MPNHSRSRSRRKRKSRGPSSNRKSRSRNHTQSPAHRPRSARGVPRNPTDPSTSKNPPEGDANNPSTSYYVNPDDTSVELTDLNDVLEDPTAIEEEASSNLPQNPTSSKDMGVEEEAKLNNLCKLLERMEQQYSPSVSCGASSASNNSTPEKKDKGEGAVKKKKKEGAVDNNNKGTPKKKADNSDKKTSAAPQDQSAQMSQEEKAALRKAKKEQKKKGKQNKTEEEPTASPKLDDVKDKENKSPNKEQPKNDGTPTKSKAELKRERREKQEAQRASKLEQQKQAEATKSSQPKEVLKPKQTTKQVDAKKATQSKTKKADDIKKMPLVGHLSKPVKKPIDMKFNNAQIHPAVKSLGIRIKTRVIDGCNARVVATLLAFKKLVNDYKVPESCDLSRDLSDKLAVNVDYLKQCRMMPPSIENAIRSFKSSINNISPSLPEAQCKMELMEHIDDYITNNIKLAGDAIKESALELLQEGDVILTYGYSYLIFEVIKEAISEGKKLVVVVVENTQTPTGLSLLQLLHSDEDIADHKELLSTIYTTLTNLPTVIDKVTKVLVEAEGVLLNGAVVGPVGQAAMSMMAYHCSTPVIVLSQTYKFCNNDLTDSLDNNELGDEESIIRTKSHEIASLGDHLYVANLCYDITPPDIVTLLVTERGGRLATSSVPVIIKRNFSDILGHD